MKRWGAWSLSARATVLFALVACVVTGMLGTYFYQVARQSLERQADLVLAARVAHFSRLVREMYTVRELKERPLLFETMLGSERDMLFFRKPGEAPFIHVNPDNLPIPSLTVSVQDHALGPVEIQRTFLPDGVPVHWVSARTLAREDGTPVDVIAGHPMTSEVQMLKRWRNGIVLATLGGMLAATLLAFAVLWHLFKPLRGMVRQAAQISPKNLMVRLNLAEAPPELQQLTQAFNAMLDRLAEGYQRLSQFSADLAHEIRTPVGILTGQTQVALGQARQPEEYRKVLESNLEELERLSRIIENILFLAQADHAALVIARQPMALHEEMSKIADYFEGLASERGMRFSVQAEGQMWANPLLCRRAINNLVVNALRYGADDTCVRLSATQHAQGATVWVENDGEPVTPAQLGRLFDRFYRGDAARSTPSTSNGLGLAIVSAIMHLHGGTAQVSCPRPGVIRFVLEFPARAVQ
ncbi:heavy metal sensor histidine kinase [Paraburkholderia bonniea]|uniref:heavy metal sensor histidine kinase n=1 Tax=Paraburkholderia bonniea TaxID=2152891 RepID=UPI00129129AE|nr:heavy metal sensor histidine kinase [Paraburkholderia bonniea]